MIWIAQCLCPQRHCLLAVATDEGPVEGVRLCASGVRGLLLFRELNPWCGLCGAPADTWTYEAGETAFNTMEEARPELGRLQAENQRTHDEMIADGRAYDSQRRSQN